VIQPTVSRGRLPLTGRRGVLFVIESTTMSAAQDPYPSFNFLVEIDAITVAGFRSSSQPERETSLFREATLSSTSCSRQGSSTSSSSISVAGCTSLRDSQAPAVSNAAGAERVER
jgi:hypothetical protein